MKPFGEMAIVEENARRKIHAKLENLVVHVYFWVMPQIMQMTRIVFVFGDQESHR
jgi:hypothetical protein